MEVNEEVADKIAELASEYYRKLKPSAKPTVRSNGTKEWNVLACVVAINRANEDLRLVSLATGVKAAPNEDLKRSNGRILHDCHAEILALRGFNAVLLKQIQLLKDSQSHPVPDLVSSSSDNSGIYRLNEEWSFALYISRAPCGDASMGLLYDEGCISFTDDDRCQYVDDNNKTIIRGRFNYAKKGYVRTKPGRKDSKVTLSKSCTDKLCSKQVLSILNSLTWDLLEAPVFLEYIVIPQLPRVAEADFERAFDTRIKDSVPMEKVQILSCSQRFDDDKTYENQPPSLMSSILLNIIEGQVTQQQSILNGVKCGAFVKPPNPLKKNCETVVSRASQWSLFKQIKGGVDSQTYREFKSQQTDRNALKERIRLALSKDGWVGTESDDCG
ncbi:tRNA-specific adenosine deaminase [Lachancea thermotolerans CBS 6340]|uniref:KLTH0G00748p n=1 Tax=Lachancea thermotolerans (strain ATCC 56472 / CBS 6340 / NRRL Y-8284) TaxID=559295 RepID=C5DLH4_LACTC|nr:KLTH0G00748p [Lachancea thermotolerans CBS 6340]CAR24635.1 KLTH0G00748p [Lachancea thermotolerans CBS 6340]